MSSVPLLLGVLCFLLFTGSNGAGAENATLCWGNGNAGQLGNGQSMMTTARNLPYTSSVPVFVSGNQSFAAVCAGESHSCALEPSGKAWCWGFGSYGGLGAGSNSDSAVPVEVAGGHTFRSITCGGGHTCAVDDQSKAWCWGQNRYGQLGTGYDADSSVPVQAAVGRTFTALAAGGLHTCGLDSSGKACCWGSNSHGQLGAGMSSGFEPGVDDPASYVPVEVSGNLSFASISSGAAFSCALTQQNTAWCWGDDTSMQLGPNGNRTETTPVFVSTDQDFTAIAAGSAHTCALAVDGRLFCWGMSPANGLDMGSFDDPREVGGGRTFRQVSAGTGLNCALDPSGTVWCMGINMSGELGNGGTFSSTKMINVAGGHQFVSLGQTHFSHICAIATRQASPGELNPSPVPSTAPPVPASAPTDSNSTAATGGSSSPPASTSSEQSSSVPVGAIVGGIVGAAVVLAVLAFCALRPGKGWLRRKHAAAVGSAAAAAGGSKWGKEMPTPGSSTAGSSAEPGGQPANAGPSAAQPPAAAASPLQAAWTSSSLGQDTFLHYSRTTGAPPISQASVAAPTEPAGAPPSNISAAGWAGGSTLPRPQPLPASYVSSAGLASGPLASGPAVAGAAWTASHSSSATSAASDPVLAFVSTHVASQPRPNQQQRQPSALARGSSGGSSGAFELRTDARVWEVQWAELTVQRLLGRGSFGSVYLAEWNQVPVAVKVLISKDDLDRGQLQLPEKVLHELQAEAAVMSHMRHPNVVQFMGLVALPPALITEYCSRGSLYDCLVAAHEQPAAAAQLTWRRRLGMAVDAGAGLLYLHRRSIIHRDIKSPNLLVDEHWRVKVADFNLSKLLEGARPESSLTSAAATNPIWLAPEVLEGCPATAASDVYSFGMVLFELLTWRLPWTFANMTPFKVGATIRQGGRPEVPPRQALPGPDTAAWAGLDAYVQLMRDCWAQHPDDRPSFDEVVGRLRRLLADTAGG